MEQIAHTTEQLAQAILDLINSQPRTPTKDELVAVIAAHLEPGRMEVPAKPTETWVYQSIDAWQYLEAEREHYEFVTRVGAKVAPDDPQEEAAEAKCDALSHAVRAQARHILASPIKTWLDLDARAWLVLLASDFDFDFDLPEAARRGNVAALPARLDIGDAYGAGEQAAVDLALYVLRSTMVKRAPSDG
jgi:hypothetical protein